MGTASAICIETLDINGNGLITNADWTLSKQAVFNAPPMDDCF